MEQEIENKKMRLIELSHELGFRE